MADSIKIPIEVDLTGKALPDIKKELRGVKDSIDEMRRAGLENTEAFKKTLEYGTQLKHRFVELSKEQRNFGSATKMSSFQLLEYYENLTVVTAGIFSTIKALKDFGAELVTKGAELNVLKSNFKGTEEQLNALRTASAGTLTDIDLMKISNQAELLNINLKDQATILGFVEERFDLFGGNVKEGFEKLLTAVQGGSKGLRSLRIDTEAYNQNLAGLVKTMGGSIEVMQGENNEKEIKIKQLPAEVQMQLRLQAVMQTLNYTYEDSQKKTKDLRDKTEALKVATENARASIGEGLTKALFGLADSLGLTSDASNKTIGTTAVLGSQLAALIPIIAQLKIAFPSMSLAAIGSIGGISAAIVGVGSAMAYLSDQLNNLIPFSFSNPADAMSSFFGKKTEKIIKEQEERIAKENADPNNFNAVDSKGAKFVNGKWVKLTDADIQTADLTAQMNKIINDATKPPTTGTGGKTAKQSLEEQKEIILQIDKLLKDLTELQSQKTEYESRGLTYLQGYEETLRKISETESKIRFERGESKPGALSLVETDTPDMNVVSRNQPNYDIEKFAIGLSIQKSLIEDARNQTMAYTDAINTLGTAFGNLFGSLVNGESFKESFSELMKSIIGTVITTIEALLVAAASAMWAKGVFMFGTNLVSDMIYLSLATAGLEAARTMVSNFADGGYVSGPGSSTSDSIPARLSNGEFVVNAKATSQYLPLLSAINGSKTRTNYGRFATGGLATGGLAPNVYVTVQSEVERTKWINVSHKYAGDVSNYQNNKVIG